MSNKRSGNRDNRVEPLPAGTPVDSVTNYKVDRVFAPAPRVRPTEAAAEAANAVLEKRRSTSTVPPVLSGSPPTDATDGELELSLRRQLSRLQRQLAEAQRELANKDDELAAAVEKRLSEASGVEQLTEANRQLQLQIDELQAAEAKNQGIDQRLQDSLAAYDELAVRLDRERETVFAANARVDELTRAFDETRSLWNIERQMLEERAAAETAQLETQRTAALEAADQELVSATSRQRVAHEAEITEIKEAHERSLSTLRGELEPKALEARNLAEERERLASEITALKSEAIRASAEREDAHTREIKQLTEGHAAEVATQSRTAAAELAKILAERDLQALELQQLVRAGEAREQSLEDSANGLRETQLKMQRELTEAKERVTQLEGDLENSEGRRALAQATTEKLLDEVRQLRTQLEASSSESRRNAMDRMRFVAFLEEGLALLGALPEAVVEMDADEPADPDGGDPEIPPEAIHDIPTVTFR
ncbi:MAG: hypothetical protein H0T42_16385 [Deltaproteobacteria bacterium]|nr:hypothetical protein [Deltaproteobacteria bacterium]